MKTNAFAATLIESENPYLSHPVRGVVEVLEVGTDHSIIQAGFRVLRDDGTLSALVQIKRPRFVYEGGISPSS